MAEYIRLEDAFKVINGINCTDYGAMSNYEAHGAVRDVLQDISRYIESLSVVDATPVVHGRNVTDQHPVDEFVCSECGFTTRDIQHWVYDEDFEDWTCYEYEPRFCPECGAKMDLKEGDTEWPL